MESKRQKQLASDIQRIIGKAFQQDLREHLKGAFVTVSNVSVTPDLLIARVNVSVLQKEKEKEVVESLQQNSNIARVVAFATDANPSRVFSSRVLSARFYAKIPNEAVACVVEEYRRHCRRVALYLG